MLSLAAPIVVGEVGWMAMAIVDTLMVGRLPHSAEAIGAVSLGGILYYTCVLYGGALMLGLDTLVSQSYGAGALKDCHRSLWTGLFLAIALTPVLMLANLGIAFCLPRMGVNAAVAPAAMRYLLILNWGTPALMAYFVLRRYLQAMLLAKPFMLAMVTANLINLAGNWALIYGHAGAPALGTDGSAWSTVVARWYILVLFIAFLLYYERARSLGIFRVPLTPDWKWLRQLIKLGFPATNHIVLEVGVFAAATALISQLDPGSLAAHQIVLNVVSLTFMVPMGISAAAAVRVGQAIGRRDAHAASRAGWTAIGLAASFMSCAALLFLIEPRGIAALYTTDRDVIQRCVTLLVIAAVFQLFDGCQISAVGALRGAGDTRTPMWCNLVFYWLVGLPVGYLLCFHWRRGAQGLWMGLCGALVLIGSVLLLVWRAKARALRRSIEPCSLLVRTGW